MSNLSTHSHAYLSIALNGDTHEAGITFIYWPDPNVLDKVSIIIDIVSVDCDVHIPHQFVKSAVKKYLKTKPCKN